MLMPWGELDWLWSRFDSTRWRLVTCASFEPRSVACSEWIAKNVLASSQCPHVVVRVADPVSAFTAEIEDRTDANQLAIEAYIRKCKLERMSLLEDGRLYTIASEVVADAESIMLDITAMPKRVFLFLVKRLMASQTVRNLIVCYARPTSYKEGPLSGDAQPPAALPGFGRIASATGTGVAIVSVGYMGFNLSELLQQLRGRKVKFIFPFPPGSPSFRRNWRMLHQLGPAMPIQTDIQRVHSLDMFALLSSLHVEANEHSGPIDMIPLGPKPHALAMALAARHIGDRAEIIYSQPRLYYPEYSAGLLRTTDGRPDIKAYCLKRHGVSYA